MNTLSRNESIQLIRNCLGIPYDENKFRQLIANIFPNTNFYTEKEIIEEDLPNIYRQHINSYKTIVKFQSEKENIDVLTVKIKNFGTMIKARTMQRQFIGRYLNGAFDGIVKDAALVAFYCDNKSDWRLSLVYKEYSFDDTGFKTTLSEPRRCSFLVGPNELTHTAEQQLVNLLQTSDRYYINRLKEAFSVEKVTNEFFLEYKKLFQKLTNTVEDSLTKSENSRNEFNKCGITPTVYAKRLLGQIVFLYFLQKKGWLGVDNTKNWGDGSPTFLQDIFNKYSDKNFFSDLLNPLFYEALATDRKNENYCFKLLNCRIPFLNGGLFEPIGGHDWHKVNIIISNNFFRELFKIFDRYNFTVCEDEPLEREVAVDPEMLGKIFESLLDLEERRSQGTFYTPRWIVHYMCRESLIRYLDRAINYTITYSSPEQSLPGVPPRKKLGTLPGVPVAGQIPRYIRQEIVPFKDIKQFIRYDEYQESNYKLSKINKYLFIEHDQDLPKPIITNAKKIDEALAKVKVCDPAIGSGAFAVGMMLEIVHARQRLHQAQPNLFDDIYKDGNIESSYILKRNTIRNSLYGVDQEASAVDIAKLRLWLSLVVDEDDFYQIKPLPNLDYKIMVGNSLTAWKDSNTLSYIYVQELQNLQNKYYSTIDHHEKIRLKKEIKDIRSRNNIIEDFDWNIDFPNIMSSDSKNKGFDIIIGNPPYIQIQKLNLTTKNSLKNKYKTYSGTGDLYCIFHELGIKLLKKFGILTFITSNSWMRAAYGEELRNYLNENCNILRLIDFAGNKVFDSATVDVNIIVVEKNKTNKTRDSKACIIKDDCSTNLSDYLEHNSVTTRFEVGQSWAVLTPIEQSIKQKIESLGKPLKDWEISINYGIKTGLNKAFIISGSQKDELISADPKSAEIIRPILRGRDITRYGYNFADMWLINTHNGVREKNIRPVNVFQYPAIKTHLDKYYEKLCKRQDKGITPYNLRNCIYMEDFSKQKIIWAEISDIPKFAFDKNGEFFITNKAFLMTGNLNLSYLYYYLNSKISEIYFSFIASTTGEGTCQWFKYKIESIPVIEIDNIKTLDMSCKNIHNKIEKFNYLLYKILNLTQSEILFCESFRKI